MILKSLLDNLKPEQRAKLMHAFNQGFSQHVELDNNKFVGVNINQSHFKIEESAGDWSYGTIKKG